MLKVLECFREISPQPSHNHKLKMTYQNTRFRLFDKYMLSSCLGSNPWQEEKKDKSRSKSYETSKSLGKSKAKC